jgi:type II secretory pathway pseudopilin PulG
MRRVGVGLLGLVIGLALVWYLAYTEIIEIGLFSPSYGLWLIPAVLIGSPAVLLLLDAGQWKPALVIVAMLLVFASPRLVVAGRRMQEQHAWRRQAQAEQNRVEQLRTQQRRRGETLALQAFGTDQDVQTVVRPDQCGGVLVQVTGQGRIMWYWYDSAQDRNRGQPFRAGAGGVYQPPSAARQSGHKLQELSAAHRHLLQVQGSRHRVPRPGLVFRGLRPGIEPARIQRAGRLR